MNAAPSAPAKNKIIRRFGGRHFVYRVKYDRWWMIPKPYALISSIRGPVWAFYGVGQIWITHKKWREIEGWFARISRVGADALSELIASLQEPLESFIRGCNENEIRGTIVIEKKVIEFHWTVGRHVQKPEKCDERDQWLEAHFKILVDAFAKATSVQKPAPADVTPTV